MYTINILYIYLYDILEWEWGTVDRQLLLQYLLLLLLLLHQLFLLLFLVLARETWSPKCFVRCRLSPGSSLELIAVLLFRCRFCFERASARFTNVRCSSLSVMYFSEDVLAWNFSSSSSRRTDAFNPVFIKASPTNFARGTGTPFPTPRHASS